MFKKTITIIIFLALTLSVISIPQTVKANDNVSPTLNFTPQTSIPGSEFQAGTEVPVGTTQAGVDKYTGREATTIQSTLVSRYVRSLYNYAIGLVGILAVIMVLIGGLLWLTSGGNPDKISNAKTFISGALMGLVLVLFSYTLLKTVNSQLVELPSIDTVVIGAMQYGCCAYTDEDGVSRANDITNVECTQKGGVFDENMSANQAKTGCLPNGCCKALETIVMATGTVYMPDAQTYTNTYCYETNENMCDIIKQEDNRRAYTFLTNKCEAYSDCIDNQASCEDVDDGDECDNAQRVCYCFEEKPYFGRGTYGEPCGDGDGGICYEPNNGIQTHATGCINTNKYFDDRRGRECIVGGNDFCCYYDPS